MPNLTAANARRELRTFRNPAQAKRLASFFRTAPGQYGHGDRFLGLKVPMVRAVARSFRDLPLREISRLLSSPWHEDRLLAVVILDARAKRARTTAQRRELARFFLAHRRRVNNWDLVDVSTPRVVGAWLFETPDRGRGLLLRLIRSSELWDRRIALLASFFHIRERQFEIPLTLAARVLDDREDLIHKASGWMLREIGKRDRRVLERFLDLHARRMPRTMLRYSIEHFPKSVRCAYMNA